MQTLPKILLVEDDQRIAGALAYALHSCYEVELAGSGRLALYKSDLEIYEIIMLDLNLPDLSGMEICQQLRERGVRAPILILTGESRILTKISLLDAGANDYLTKPFSLGELKARLRALSRAQPLSFAPRVNELVISGVQLNRHTNQVSRDGVLISLRRKEFALLECLMEHAGSVVSRDTLVRYAWHGTADLWTNTVDVHIKYLRDKLDRPFGRALIQTVHGLGYRIAVQEIIILDKN